MSERLSPHLGVVIAIFIALLTVALSQQAVAQVQCPSGNVPITAATRAIATAAGLPSSVQCWDPNNPNAGQAVGDAKQYLQTLLKPVQQCITPQQQIEGINSSFAICAARFIQAYQQQGGKVTITRAYNTIQCEAALCVNNAGCGGFENSPAPNSSHVQGIAMDLSSPQQAQMDAFANQNPQFGVCFPLLKQGDVYHLVLAGVPGNGESKDCATFFGMTQACSGSNFNPSEVPPNYPSAPGTVGNPAPTLSSATQNPLLPSQSPTVTANPFSTSPISPTQSAQTQACTPQYVCSANTVSYESSSCTTQVVQTCQYGCSGTVCAPSPSQSASSSLPGLSQNSAITGTTAIGTSTSLLLNASLSQSVQGSIASQGNPANVVTTVATGSGYTPDIGQTTFSFNSSGSVNTEQSLLSPLQRLLQQLRGVLVSILNFLNPPSTQPSTQTY